MPSPSPQRAVTRASFKPVRKKAADLPPRAKQLVELMVWENLSLNEVAARMGIAMRTARQYFALPAGRRFYDELLARMRDSERARNVHTAVGIRDDKEMAKSAAGNRARLAAIDSIEQRVSHGTIVINNQNVAIQPGYLVSVAAGEQDRVHKILEAAGSTARAEIVDVEVAAEVEDSTPTLPQGLPHGVKQRSR